MSSSETKYPMKQTRRQLVSEVEMRRSEEVEGDEDKFDTTGQHGRQWILVIEICKVQSSLCSICRVGIARSSPSLPTARMNGHD